MVRKLLTIGLFVLITATLVSTAFASNGTQIGTVGARATSMGSCFRGLADDWSAVFFNPAGLTQLGKWTIGGSTGLIIPRGSYTAAPYPVYPFSGMYTTQVDVAPKNFYVPSIAVFYKPSEKFVVGLGVYAPFGLGTEWDLLKLPASYGNATGISKQNESSSDHQVIDIQPTVAFKLSEKISVGLGLSYVWGKMDIDQVVLPLNPMLAEIQPGVSKWAALQLAVATLGGTLPDLTADQDRLVVENDLSGDGSAYGFNFGLHFKLSEKLSVGFSGRYWTDLKLSGTNKMIKIMSGDATKAGVIQTIPANYLADQNDPTGEVNKAQLLALFSGQNISEEYDAKANLPLPMTLGGGIAFKPCPKLTLTADFSWTNWAKWDKIAITGKNHETINLEENWKNTIELGGGFEFLAMEKESSKFFVRGGFYTVNTPAPDETMSPTILDPNRRYVITGGLGLNLGKISFNLAYENVLFKDKNVEQYVFDSTTGAAQNYAGLYKFHASVITFGTNIGF